MGDFPHVSVLQGIEPCCVYITLHSTVLHGVCLGSECYHSNNPINFLGRAVGGGVLPISLGTGDKSLVYKEKPVLVKRHRAPHQFILKGIQTSTVKVWSNGGGS